MFEINRKLKNADSPGLWFISVLAIQALLISQTLFKVLPPTNGFFLYWAKLSQTKIPYVDFYFPLPPLSLLVEGQLPNLFTNPVLAEQILQAIKWLVIAGLLFAIIRKLGFEPRTTFVGVTIAASAYYVSPGNITAGYLELAWLFLLAATLFGLKTAEYNSKKIDYFLVTFFLSLAVLTKQSAIIPAAMAAFIVLFFLVKSGNSKRIISNVGSGLLGIGIVTIPILIWAQVQGCLPELLAQAFGVGGKNPAQSNWKFWLLDGFGLKNPMLPLLLLAISLVCFTFISQSRKVLNSFAEPFLVAGGFVFLSVSVAAMSGLNLLAGAAEGKSASIGILLLALVCGFGTFSEINGWSFSNGIFLSVIVLLSTLAFIFLGPELISHDVNLSEWYFSYLPYMNLLGGTGVLLMLLLTWKAVQQGEKVRTSQLALGFGISFGFAAMNSLSAGLSIETWLLPLAFVISWVLSQVLKNLSSPLSQVAAMLVCLTLLIPFGAAQSRVPYNWWGVYEDSLASPHQKLDLPQLSGFTLGEQSGGFYSRLDDALEVVGESGEDQRVLIGPNLAGLAGSVFPQMNTYELGCPILWWDICTEEVSNSDFEKVKRDNPEVIVWNMAPENVIVGHELGFSDGGKSGVRKIQEWITQQITTGQYEIVEPSGAKSVPKVVDEWTLVVLQKKN